MPQPLSTPAAQCENASRQKNRLILLACPRPIITASSTSTKNLNSCGANRNTITPISSANATPDTIPNAAPFFALSYFFAPRFCPINVGSEIDMLVIGRKAKPSILLYAPTPDIAYEPNELMLVCTTIFPILITEFWTPFGSP